jgi:hypothetical protein
MDTRAGKRNSTAGTARSPSAIRLLGKFRRIVAARGPSFWSGVSGRSLRIGFEAFGEGLEERLARINEQ